MRLTEYQQKVIKNSALKIFGEQVSVFIFGSRTDDNLFGGDIDIYLENISESDNGAVFHKKIKFLSELEKKLGEQKIDIVINKGNQTSSIILQARATGIRL